MLRFQTVIFDLDGLVVDTEPLHQRAFNAMLSLVGVEHQFELDEYGEIFTGRSVFENAEYIRERFALPQTAPQLGAAHLALFTLLISDANNLEPMLGVRELVAWLAERRVQMGIASSSHPEQVEVVLRGLNLHHHFETLVGNDGRLKPKPAPDLYLTALNQLGARPDETLALEDSSSGVRAAHAAGVYVIAVPNPFTARQDFAAADAVMRDLVQVREFLDPSL